MSQEPPPLPGNVRSVRNLFWIGLSILAGLGLLILLGFGVVKGVEKMAERRKQTEAAKAEFDDFAKENTAKLRKSLESDDGVEGSADSLAAAQKKLGALAEKMPPMEKTIMLAGQEAMEDLQLPLKQYEAAYGNLLQNHSFNATGLKTREDLALRRQDVESFSEANELLATTFANLGEKFRSRLQARQVSKLNIDAAVRGFQRSAHTDLVAAIREDDRQLVKRMLEALDLYSKSWGKWKLNEEGGLIFEESADLDRYNSIIASIEAIAKHQEDLQQKLLADQEQKQGS